MVPRPVTTFATRRPRTSSPNARPRLLTALRVCYLYSHPLSFLIYPHKDFCIWAPPQPNSTIGDTEAIEVAWCTNSAHGTRLIPAGALTGVQILITSQYVQFVASIDQTLVNLAASDYGGELDPHGADLVRPWARHIYFHSHRASVQRGNPLGGLVYTNGFFNANGAYLQVMDWNAQVLTLFLYSFLLTSIVASLVETRHV